MFAYCGNNPINCCDPSGNRPIWEKYESETVGYTDTGIATPFYSSIDEAAYSVGITLSLNTQKTNKEFAANILKTSKGYYIGDIIEGEHAGVDMTPLLVDGLMALVHSHPNCTVHIGNEFSKYREEMPEVLVGDAAVSFYNRVSIYLAAPNGTLQRMIVIVDPKSNSYVFREKTLYYSLPKDITVFDCDLT